MSKTTSNGAAIVAKSQDLTKYNTWMATKRYWYMLSFIFPFAPMLSVYLTVESGSGLWLWLTPVVFYGLTTVLDNLFGNDDANPTEKMVEEMKDDRYFVHILYLAVAGIWASVISLAYVVATIELSWFAILGGALSAGLMGGVSLLIGHELGHKVRDRGQITAAKIALAVCGYGHFIIEHNKGHHKDVATPDDPASSRFGESIYKFVQREIPGAFRRAWQLEAERLHRQGKSEWSLSNEIIQPALLTITAYTLMLAYFGPVMIPFLAITAIVGYWHLTLANYIEHYGLLRQKEASGRFERCQPRHSWNSNHKLSNLMTLHLQRHSDHHAHPTRPYQSLRDYPDAPQLPQGYPWMFLVAMFPPVWFSIMDPRTLAWANNDMNKLNIDPDVREEAFARYHQKESNVA